MSRRSVDAWSVFAHACTEENEEISHRTKAISTPGEVFRMFAMSASADFWLRPLKKIFCGLCFAKASIEPAPRPAVPERYQHCISYEQPVFATHLP